ncbi:MAG: NAD(P)/FAD-dependent oxidoreductase [Myxococcaceae bacterium]|nr:NAD(P)/FAD-dependent oxidoreductase [Myxococcaceae bacterium]
MHYKTDIAIIGTGFAGLGMAIRLKQEGIHDFVIFERGEDVGGTWRDNFYPGAACDVQSHLYSFSFAPNPDWSRQFAPQAEILDYLRSCAEKFDLLSHIHFGNGLVEGRYDEARGLWLAKTQRGDTIEARAVITGCGAFNKPVVPDIKGIHEFQGELLHTARWKKGASLKGKRVAVIGTGASAIQVVPAIAPDTAKLTLFQRTPPWIMPKPNPAYTPEQKKRFRSLPVTQLAERAKIYAKNELFATGFILNPKLMKQGEKFSKSYLKAKVKDPVLREKLTPNYTIGCKRVLLSSDYLTTLTRDNVEVVTDGIAEVRAHSIVTKDGREHPIDTLVCATGFQVSENVAPFAIYGRGGLELNAAWLDSGAEAYKGTTVKGFPNAFIIMGPNTGLGHSSMVLMIEAQIGYALQAIQLMRSEKLKSIEVRPEVQDRYNRWVQKRMARTVWQRGGCVSYYATASGKNTTLFPGFTFEFIAKTRKFDSDSYVLEKQEQRGFKTSVVRMLGLKRGRATVASSDAAE